MIASMVGKKRRRVVGNITWNRKKEKDGGGVSMILHFGVYPLGGRELSCFDWV